MPEDTYRLIVAECGGESVFFGKCSEKNEIIQIDGRKARLSDVTRKYNDLRNKLGYHEIDEISHDLLKMCAAVYVLKKSKDQDVFKIRRDDIVKDDILTNWKYDEGHAKTITDFFGTKEDKEYPEYLKSISKKS